MHKFNRATFTNVSEDSMAWIEKPNPGWATTTPLTSPSNCGNWPCTAPENVVLSFKNTVYESNSELDEDNDF